MVLYKLPVCRSILCSSVVSLPECSEACNSTSSLCIFASKAWRASSSRWWLTCLNQRSDGAAVLFKKRTYYIEDLPHETTALSYRSFQSHTSHFCTNHSTNPLNLLLSSSPPKIIPMLLLTIFTNSFLPIPSNFSATI